MIKTTKSLVEIKKQIKILREEKTYLEEREKLEAQPNELKREIENNLGVFNQF